MGSGGSVVALLGLGILGYAALIERNAWRLQQVSVPLLPPGAAPFRILHISDLHLAPWQRAKQAWLRGLASLAPDLVVSTGDVLGHLRGIEGARAALGSFAGIPGVYVHGSNDYFAPKPLNPLRYFAGPSRPRPAARRLDTGALETFFADLGWVNLTNRVAALTVAGVRLTLFGVDDPHRGLDRLDLLAARLDELNASDDTVVDDLFASDDDDPAVSLALGVTHAPYRRVLDAMAVNGADLVLAGHTHGGQVCLPGYGALVTNCDVPRDRVRGLSVWTRGLHSTVLHVSAGVGTSIYAPVRFACPPEATLLTLIPRGGA